MSKEKYPAEGHPWADFLYHRARALRWLRDGEKKTPEQIAKDMSMDATQVRLILMEVDSNQERYAS